MKLRSSGGFTLFELIIAIAIVALVMGIAVSQMDRVFDLDMKNASNKLASTIRYIYNKAATDGLYMRLVFDLDERTYWVEATTDPTKVSADMEEGGEDEKEEGKKEEKAKEEKKTEGEKEKKSGEGTEKSSASGEVESIKYPKPSFGQVDSFLLKPEKISDNVFFKDVFVEHLPAGVEAGKVAIYFFPNGYVEHAVINLRNEDDDFYYSIETNPGSGRVSIENEYRTLEGKGK